MARQLDKIAPHGKADFFRDVAYEVPAYVLFTLMGIPDADVPKVKNWAVSRALLTWGNLSDEEQIPHRRDVAHGLDARHVGLGRDEPPQDLVQGRAQPSG